MYATNNGSTNKAPNSNSTNLFDNTITVTPIKVELGGAISYGATANAASKVAPPGQRRTPNAVVVTTQQQQQQQQQQHLHHPQATLSMPTMQATLVTNSGSVSVPPPSTTCSSMSVTLNTAMPKEKTPSTTTTKASRVQVARKPPPTIDNFWPNILQEVNGIGQVDAKHQVLPLARIKKIMKLDENAKMIAGEAPLLFAKACEYFIQELTMRAWVHTEESRRRTLQRSDIAQAIANYDQFDFLIDIVPREEIKPSPSSSSSSSSSAAAAAQKSNKESSTTANATNTSASNNINSGQSGLSSASASCTSANISNFSVPTAVSAGLKLETASDVLNFSTVNVNPELFASQVQQAQVHHQQQQQPQQVQIIQQGAGGQQLQYFIALPGQQAQTQQAQNHLGLNIVTAAAAQQPTQQLILTAGPNGQLTATPAPTQQQQLLQNLAQAQAQAQVQQQQQHQQVQQQQQQIQLLQQVVTPTGELANVPISINANQLHLLRLQHPQQQQVIIPTQLLTGQQILQLGANAQQQQQQQQQQVQVQQHLSQTSASATTQATPIFINSTNGQAQTHQNPPSQTISSIQQSNDRSLSGAFR
ncbi:uncharacterized protein Dwil_GK10349 [Drosophila willistoni]|uniref:Nuclear transcription factor Y subunit gamma n=1 Tax=Drosophila willistoni TaxID=7260 RepID=B4MJ95_DROWI|nr:uncharacterized protein Dwil_GK10349 [Drosophila willistoni]